MEEFTVHNFKNYALRMSGGFGRGYDFFRSLSNEHDLFWKRINAFRNLRLREQGLFVSDENESDEEIFDNFNPVKLTLGEWESFKENLRKLVLEH